MFFMEFEWIFVIHIQSGVLNNDSGSNFACQRVINNGEQPTLIGIMQNDLRLGGCKSAAIFDATGSYD